MTEKNKGILNEPLNAYHIIGGFIVMIVLYGIDTVSSAINSEPEEQRTTQQSNTKQHGSVHPSSSHVVTPGRNYVFQGNYVTTTREELRRLDELLGNRPALMNRVNNSPYVHRLYGSPVVTVVRREGGVLSPEHLLIQTESGEQYWTVPEFLGALHQ